MAIMGEHTPETGHECSAPDWLVGTVYKSYADKADIDAANAHGCIHMHALQAASLQSSQPQRACNVKTLLMPWPVTVKWRQHWATPLGRPLFSCCASTLYMSSSTSLSAQPALATAANSPVFAMGPVDPPLQHLRKHWSKPLQTAWQLPRAPWLPAGHSLQDTVRHSRRHSRRPDPDQRGSRH